ncbi:hypothetical protein [Geomonas subterranea]|uniref:hypothetical protein n=1 Tax=Geomonas subterranea TaxID=2847989 RepID=UPI001CD65C32|nr:hypothetical protein [Geomonas fuzhouensis]
MARVTVTRGSSHPWTGEKGWDRMEILTDGIDELEAYVDVAEAKFWRPWLIGKLDGTPAAVMYKPSGARSAWTDPPGR